MNPMRETAEKFFDACESGKGWDGCKDYCRPDATFSAQADALNGVDSVEAYTNWMKSLYGPIPDARYQVRSFAIDEQRNNVSAFGVFSGTNTGQGPVPPTGRRIEADYVYVMDFENGQIKHVTKIWNDVASLRQLGWTS